MVNPYSKAGKLDEKLLTNFMSTFYGSGNYNGRYWFIGMEEGGGNSLDEVSKRLTAWEELGAMELVDMVDFHFRIGVPEYFSDPVKLQRTWGQLIRIYLISQGKSDAISDLKVFQRDYLGRKDQDTCLLELLPLTSPNTTTWLYSKWSENPFLKDRLTYQENCLGQRCDHIRSQVYSFKPSVVVFYGKSYRKWWKIIAGPEVVFQEDSKAWFGVKKDTLFVISNHPTAREIGNVYFENIGIRIRSHIFSV
jgi:hypothetical protein